jgi:hypothetical protein
VDAFEACVPYFCESHIQVVTLLRRRDPALAVSAVVTYFLVSTAYLWFFSPTWTCTEVIAKRHERRNSYDYVLRDAVRDLATNPSYEALRIRLLDAFRPGPTTEMPKIGRIIFFGGVRFAFTRADTFLMENVVAAARVRDRGRPFSPILADSARCIDDCFTIRTTFKHFPPSTNFKLPDPPRAVPLGELPPELLRFNKTYHNSLFALAGGLKHFHTIIDAAQNVLASVYRFYVGRVLPKTQNLEINQAANFACVQRTEYALTVFKSFLRPPALGFVEKSVPAANRDQVFKLALAAKIEDRLRDPDLPVTQCVVDAAVDYVNEWKEKAGDRQVPCSCDEDTDYLQCGYVMQAVDLIVITQMFVQLSRLSFPFPAPIPTLKEADATQRREALMSMVKQVSSVGAAGGKIVQRTWRDERQWARDKLWFEKVALVASADLKFLLQRAEANFKEDFERGDEQIGVGSRILLFLEIGKGLTPLVEAKQVGEPKKILSLLAHLFCPRDSTEPVEPWYFRAFLLQALDVIQKLRENEVPEIPDLDKIRNPVTEEMFDLMSELASWFALNP